MNNETAAREASGDGRVRSSTVRPIIVVFHHTFSCVKCSNYVICFARISIIKKIGKVHTAGSTRIR